MASRFAPTWSTGTGKTSLVRAIVRESNAHLIVLSPHSVHRAHARESERILREAFSEASSHANSGKPSVLFIDEIDALCPHRDSRCKQDVRLASQLFTLMDSKNPQQLLYHALLWLHQLAGVDGIDPALRRPGCFDAEVEVTTPNEEKRFQILKLYTKKVPLDPNVDLEALAMDILGLIWKLYVVKLPCLRLKGLYIGEHLGELSLTYED